MERFGQETKEFMINELKMRFEESPNIFVTSFSKLKVTELQELRVSLKDASSIYMVVKNSIANRVLKDSKYDNIIEMIDGMCGVVFVGEDFIAASKALANFKKTHKTLNIKGGVLDGALVSPERITELSNMPSKEVLLGMVVSGIYSPVTGFVNSLAGIIRKFVYAISAIKEKGGNQDGRGTEGN